MAKKNKSITEPIDLRPEVLKEFKEAFIQSMSNTASLLGKYVQLSKEHRVAMEILEDVYTHDVEILNQEIERISRWESPSGRYSFGNDGWYRVK